MLWTRVPGIAAAAAVHISSDTFQESEQGFVFIDFFRLFRPIHLYGISCYKNQGVCCVDNGKGQAAKIGDLKFIHHISRWQDAFTKGTAGIKETKLDESGRTGHASNSIASVITHLAICCINRFNNDFPGIRIQAYPQILGQRCNPHRHQSDWIFR